MKKRVQKSVLITQSGPGLKKTKTQTFSYLIENSSVLNDFFGNGGPSLSIYIFQFSSLLLSEPWAICGRF